jgi:[ribosomal protein S18]-alanine N-acetyltransferase
LKAKCVVRQFQPGDMEQVQTIELYSFATDAWTKKVFLNYFRACPELFLVAVLGRRITGYIITCAGSRTAELDSIAVAPRERRQGVGQALLDQTVAQLRLRRIKTWWLMVETTNESAIQFYERYGFERAKLVKRYYAAKRDAWRMRLSLESPTATAASK